MLDMAVIPLLFTSPDQTVRLCWDVPLTSFSLILRHGQTGNLYPPRQLLHISGVLQRPAQAGALAAGKLTRGDAAVPRPFRHRGGEW